MTISTTHSQTFVPFRDACHQIELNSHEVLSLFPSLIQHGVRFDGDYWDYKEKLSIHPDDIAKMKKVFDEEFKFKGIKHDLADSFEPLTDDQITRVYGVFRRTDAGKTDPLDLGSMIWKPIRHTENKKHRGELEIVAFHVNSSLPNHCDIPETGFLYVNDELGTYSKKIVDTQTLDKVEYLSRKQVQSLINQIKQIFVIDMILGNTDRNTHNLLLQKKHAKLYAIDFGSSSLIRMDRHILEYCKHKFSYDITSELNRMGYKQESELFFNGFMKELSDNPFDNLSVTNYTAIKRQVTLAIKKSSVLDNLMIFNENILFLKHNLRN